MFVGTRVPVASLFEWLADGETLTDWLDSFPGVTREQALRVLRQSSPCVGVLSRDERNAIFAYFETL